MFVHRPLVEENDRQQVANRQTGGLLGIAITLVLLIVGLFLVQQLRSATSLQDCVMSGRTNCGPRITAQP